MAEVGGVAGRLMADTPPEQRPGHGRFSVLIADDHPIYREGAARIIAPHPDLEVVAQVADGREALEEIRRLSPDVALVDLRLPDIDGIRVVEHVEREGLACKVAIVSAYEESATVYRAIAAGARAYLSKVCSAEALCETLLTVGRGGTVIPESLQTGLAQEIRARRERSDDPVLTARELEILRLAADGLSAPDIAQRLVLSVTTVKTHLQHIYSKLEVSDRAAAVAQALRRGLLS